MGKEKSAWDWVRSIPLFVLGFVTIAPFLIVRKCLLVTVELLEAWWLVWLRWVFVPFASFLGLDHRFEPTEPDTYHYHNIRDWITNKLGAGWRYWSDLD